MYLELTAVVCRTLSSVIRLWAACARVHASIMMGNETVLESSEDSQS